MIVLDHVSKNYGPLKVLDGCSTAVERGEVVVICGPSGSGKSTLIKCVNGLVPFDQGEIRVGGHRITPDYRGGLMRLRRDVGMVFQQFELFPHLAALENVRIAQEKVLRRSRAESIEKANNLLRRVGLYEHKDKHPAQLSGGQQQRVAIARALAMDPQVILFDEPTSALDPEMVGEVLDVMTTLAQEGMTMMVVTHEMGFARRVANRVLFMDAGEIVEDALAEVFFANPSSDRARNFLNKIIEH